MPEVPLEGIDRYALPEHVRDGLRLSRGMGHKNALAGLWWGGGKGVIARRPGVDHQDPSLRAKIYRDYGRFVTGLRGCYVTAEDAGTTAEDMSSIFETTRHTSCIPPSRGGNGNPSELTAAGVVVAMEAGLEWLGLGDLKGKSLAMEGVGNVSRFMIRDLLKRGVARIVGTDIDEQALAMAHQLYPQAPLELRRVGFGDQSALAEPCDVLVPNAVGGSLNAESIPKIQAKLVCGAANNQLADPSTDAQRLAEQGILYLPDFLANRMGIVNCANEQYGCFPNDPAIQSHLQREPSWGIYQRSLEIFRRAEAAGRTPADEAVVLADELSEELHPIWGDRSWRIIQALLKEGWEKQPLIF